ncbi:hypothetical protein [Limnohabitans sp. Rim8]|uniref:hypothetical protein n=1 Tax=Limnohabitans sp. Rim8 TaxID=1100718 RepID=UPI0025DA5BAB|nr:hypothetical protein [Limnohabitans sp. Rim8]
MSKSNQVERITYAGGLYGLIAGSSKGKLQAKVEEMNVRGWNLHLIHPESLNILHLLFRLLILVLTLGIWTLGNSELIIFEKNNE